MNNEKRGLGAEDANVTEAVQRECTKKIREIRVIRA